MMNSTPAVKIQIKETDAQKTVSKRTVCRPQEITAIIDEQLQDVELFLKKRKMNPGNAYTIYHNQSEDLVELENGFIVPKYPKQDPDEEIELSELPKGKCAFATLPEPIKGMSRPHREILRWIALEGITVSFPLTEIYVDGSYEKPLKVEIRCWIE